MRTYIRNLVCNVIWFIFCCLVVSFPETGFAQNHFLWKVESGSAPVYLLGSIHLARPDVYPLPQVMEEAFAKTDVLVVEVDESQGNQQQMQQFILEKGMYPEGESLRDHLSQETLQKLESQGLPLELIAKMRPWFLSIHLTLQALMANGFNPQLGIDPHFLTKARASGKEVIGLETVEQQLEYLSLLDRSNSDEFIRYTLRDLETISQMGDQLIATWKAGDTQKLNELWLEPMRSDPDTAPIYEKLIVERNKGMTKKIKGYLEDNTSYLIVVGSAHLVGRESIVTMLQDLGYTVEQQ